MASPSSEISLVCIGEDQLFVGKSRGERGERVEGGVVVGYECASFFHRGGYVQVGQRRCGFDAIRVVLEDSLRSHLDLDLNLGWVKNRKGESWTGQDRGGDERKTRLIHVRGTRVFVWR